MHPWALQLNGWIRQVPVWPGYILLFLPFAWWLWLGLTGGLGPEPVRELEHRVGKLALQLFLVSLLITPLLHMTRINLIRFRRMIGLMAFYNMLLHVGVYLFLDNQLIWDALVKDLTKRPYIILGTFAVLALIPVALTSNSIAIRRLGAARWARVHTLVYPAVIASSAHYLWLVKAWPIEPVLYFVASVLLVAYRPAYRAWKSRSRARVRQAA